MAAETSEREGDGNKEKEAFCIRGGKKKGGEDLGSTFP